MLERDHIETTPGTLLRPLRGGVAPARHALARQHYVEEKRLRLAAEASARRHRARAILWRIAAAFRGLIATYAPFGAQRSEMPPDPAKK